MSSRESAEPALVELPMPKAANEPARRAGHTAWLKREARRRERLLQGLDAARAQRLEQSHRVVS